MLDERMLFDDLFDFRFALGLGWVRDFLPVVDAAFDEDCECCSPNNPVAAHRHSVKPFTIGLAGRQ